MRAAQDALGPLQISADAQRVRAGQRRGDHRHNRFLGGRGCGNAPRLPDNTFTDHKDVLAAAIRQVPARFRARVLVRVDGAGAIDRIRRIMTACSTLI